MGHYDMEDYYAEMRAQSAARRRAAIPVIIESLTAAHLELSRRAQDIKCATRIMAEIDYAILALRGQVQP